MRDIWEKRKQALKFLSYSIHSETNDSFTVFGLSLQTQTFKRSERLLQASAYINCRYENTLNLAADLSSCESSPCKDTDFEIPANRYSLSITQNCIYFYLHMRLHSVQRKQGSARGGSWGWKQLLNTEVYSPDKEFALLIQMLYIAKL